MASKYYQESDPSDWEGRMDTAVDLRLHQVVTLASLDTPWKGAAHTTAILGFCSDEGVRRNQGRVGAVDGPSALRKTLSNQAWHFPAEVHLLDVGNVFCRQAELEEAQLALANAVADLLNRTTFPLVLGGGHETAWGSYLGIRKALGAAAKVGIINIDAHFDLRVPSNQPNSGTPFWQMAQWSREHNSNFAYLCLGINPAANTQSLFETAHALGVDFLTTDDLASLPAATIPEKLTSFVQAHDYLYLSIDLDAFDAAFAPGVSAPASLGLFPLQVLPWLNYISASGKLILCDICELNPLFDLDRRTAKLGASLLYRLLQNLRHSPPELLTP